MICAGIKNNIVEAVINCPDDDTYAKFSLLFDNLIDVSGYTVLPQIGWEYSNDQFNYGQLSSVPSVKITKLAFRSRLTPTEKGTILAFGLTNITNTSNPQLQMAAAQILSMLDDQRDASYIDLCRQDLILGLNTLAAAPFNLLSPARVLAILTTPPTHEEVYKG